MLTKQYVEDFSQNTFVRIFSKLRSNIPLESHAQFFKKIKDFVSNFYHHQRIQTDYLKFTVTL